MVGGKLMSSPSSLPSLWTRQRPNMLLGRDDDDDVDDRDVIDQGLRSSRLAVLEYCMSGEYDGNATYDIHDGRNRINDGDDDKHRSRRTPPLPPSRGRRWSWSWWRNVEDSSRHDDKPTLLVSRILPLRLCNSRNAEDGDMFEHDDTIRLIMSILRFVSVDVVWSVFGWMQFT